MADVYDFPVFSSGSPVINQLFANEFAVRNARQAALEAEAIRQVQRQQFGSQERIAQTQARSYRSQQENADLFKTRQLEQGDRQLGLLESDLKQRGKAPLDIEKERRGAAVRDQNSTARVTAQKFQDLYNSKLEQKINVEKEKEKDALWGYRNWRPGQETEIDKAWNIPGNDKRKVKELEAWQETEREVLADRTTGHLVVPDSKTRTFRPALLDESGNLLGAPAAGTTPTTSGSAAPLVADPATGTEVFGPPVPFTMPAAPAPAPVRPVAPMSIGGLASTAGDYFGRWLYGTPAAPGTAPAPAAPTVTPPAAAPPVAVTPPVATVPFKLPERSQWSGGKSSEPVEISIGGGQSLELSQADADMMIAQLRVVPADQRPAAAATYQLRLQQLGRARIIPTTPIGPPVPPLPPVTMRGLLPEDPPLRGPFPTFPYYRDKPPWGPPWD